MRILDYGTTKPKQTKCNRCHSRLEYTPYDVKYHTNQFHEYYYVVCPICGKWCFVTNEGDPI